MPSLIQFTGNDIINDTQKIATSTWTNNTNNLTVITTASYQAVFATPTSSGAHYIDVYNAHTSSTAAEVQLSLAYGHRKGSGSLNFTNDEGGKGKSASGVTYAQYRNLVFGDDTISDFSFDGYVPNDIFIINMNDVLTLSESSDIEMIMMYQDFVKQSDKDAINRSRINRRMGGTYT